MNKKRWLLGRGAASPNLSEQDMDQLDRRHPELSFTGKFAARSGGAEATDRDASEEDLVDRLERLRTLREDGALTEDEFAAAKARLLQRG